MSDNAENSSPEDFSFEFRSKKLPQEKQQANWKQIENAISQQPAVSKAAWLKPLLAAASVLLLAGVAWWLIKTSSSATDADALVYKTEFAKIKKITLPDGSIVTLNANSELKISTNWDETGDRQVWLDGEGYFEVEKKPATHQKFVVHTKDLDVEVLGTRFNVNTRHEKAIVSLEEGKIKLSVKGETKAILDKQGEKIIEMRPGELARLEDADSITLSTEENINFHSGWVRNEFHFNNTTLKEIATLINDVYGYKVEVKDQALLEKSINGDLRADNLQQLVDVLQLAFKLKMKIENKSIIISK
ncbi:MAG: FecR family protein [Ferruginibacter sp.]